MDDTVQLHVSSSGGLSQACSHDNCVRTQEDTETYMLFCHCLQMSHLLISCWTKQITWLHSDSRRRENRLHVFRQNWEVTWLMCTLGRADYSDWWEIGSKSSCYHRRERKGWVGETGRPARSSSTWELDEGINSNREQWIFSDAEIKKCLISISH